MSAGFPLLCWYLSGNLPAKDEAVCEGTKNVAKVLGVGSGTVAWVKLIVAWLVVSLRLWQHGGERSHAAGVWTETSTAKGA